MSNYSNNTPTLSELNNEKALGYAPVVVYVALLMAVGISGNMMVIYVFISRLKKSSNYRLFALVLSAFDTSACCIAMPGLIVDLLYPYMFYSDAGCKLLRYGYHACAASSSMIHLLIGVERYRKICRPLEWQLSSAMAKVVLLCSIAGCLVVCVPTLIIFGESPVETRVANITGTQCAETEQYDDSVLCLVFDIFLLLMFVTVVAALIICYCMIGRMVWQRNAIADLSHRFHVTSDAQENLTNGIYTGTSNISSMKHNKVSPLPYTIDIGDSDKGTRHMDSVGHSSPTHHVVTNTRSGSSRKLHHTTSKITVVTFVITLIFILSYLPYLFTRILEHAMDLQTVSMTTAEESLFHILQHSYALTSAANPLVYIFLDKDFREQCKLAICGCCTHDV